MLLFSLCVCVCVMDQASSVRSSLLQIAAILFSVCMWPRAQTSAPKPKSPNCTRKKLASLDEKRAERGAKRGRNRSQNFLDTDKHILIINHHHHKLFTRTKGSRNIYREREVKTE